MAEAALLEAPFLEEEILFALFDFNSNKALGPYGFSMVFWQSSWNFTKVEVMDFFNHGLFLWSIIVKLMVLIPKKGGVVDLTDFRGISLVGSLYK